MKAPRGQGTLVIPRGARTELRGWLSLSPLLPPPMSSLGFLGPLSERTGHSRRAHPRGGWAGPRVGWSCLSRAGCIGGLTADRLNRHIVPSLPRVPPGHFLTRRVLDELMSEARAAGPAVGRRPAAEARAGWAWRSREAERCNERRRLDLWGCARGPGLPARASTWEHKQVLAQEWRDWVLTRAH